MLNRAAWSYKSCKGSDKAVRSRIVEIANTRVCYGVNRIHVLLRREGWKDNKKRMHTEWIDPKTLTITNAGQWILWET
jgi:putative transposase